MSADETSAAPPAGMPVRWAAEPLRGSAAERRAALLFRAAIHAPSRKRADLSLVHVKLRESWTSDGARPPRRLGFTFFTARVVVGALVIVLLASSFVGAAMWWHRQARTAPPNTGSDQDGPAQQGGRHAPSARGHLRPLATPPAEARTLEGPAPPIGELATGPVAAPESRGPRGYAMSAPKSPAKSGPMNAAPTSAAAPPNPGTVVLAPTAPTVSDAGTQAALLARGLRLLHRGQDAPAAIAAFADYQARFPDGLFSDEVKAALAEAYLASGRDGDALSILEERSPATGERRRARLTLRGELRARLGRCREAIGDFEAVLVSPGRGALDERAFFGRAVCLQRLGHAAAARDAFAAYGVTFPNGRFAVEARNRMRP